jgi:MFS family permease
VNDFTATAYAGLICEEQAERSLIQSTVYIGAILGLLVITPFADTIGKKKLFVLTQGMIIVGLIRNLGVS